MVSHIEPDRYANTGFAVKVTAPEERRLMRFDMIAERTDAVRRALFHQRFQGVACPW